MARLVMLALVVAIWLAPVGATAQELRVEARPGGVVGLAPNGAERWAITHASLIGGGRRTPSTPIAPVMVGRRTFYAVDSDLLEVDAAKGRIIGRTRFPAQIGALAPAPDSPRLLVTLTPSGFPSPPTPDRVPVSYRPGDPAPGRGPWTGRLHPGPAFRDAVQLVKGFDGVESAKMTPAERDTAVKAFEAAEAVDLTNPFLRVFRGNLLAASGRRDDAARAYAAAAGVEVAAWPDLLRAASALEDADAREPARSAFARGRDGMTANGVRGPAVSSLFAALSLVGIPRRALKRAVEAGDADRVHELASRIAMTFPRLESLDRHAGAVATWMRGRGRAELAAAWSARAVGTGRVWRRFEELLVRLDRLVPFLIAAFVVPPFVALSAGARSGARRRLQATDVVAVLIPLVAATVVLTATAGWSKSLGTYASLPAPILGDGVASPDVERWLGAQPASATRERLLEHVRREAKATREGGRADQPPLDQTAFLAVVESTPLTERLRMAVLQSPMASVEMSSDPALWQLIVTTAVVFLVAWLVARWKPATGRSTWMIPASPDSLHVVGGLVFGLFLAALFTLLGADHILRAIAMPSLSIFEVPIVSPSEGRPAWAWVVLALAIALQGWAAWRARGRERARRV
jgi:hypothetical protein